METLYRVLGALCIALVADGLSKAWAERVLDFHQPVSVAGRFFRLTLGYNSGVAFGIFADGGSWPLIITGVVLLGIATWLVRALCAGEFPRETAWPVGLFLGGAVANFVDRLADGRVTDFLDLGLDATRWPAFNLADSFIVLGVITLALMTLFENRMRGDVP
jgi:signal peptidase II